MTCPSAITCLLYAEGELAGSALRETEAHLVSCRDCRARVIALREEGALLGEVLRGETHPHPLAKIAAPSGASGVALGLPLAVAAATIALAAAGALLEAHLPGAFDLLHPRRFKGAVEMAFDVTFMLRENAPGLFELGFAVGVVASVSALLSFAVGALTRRIFGTAVVLLALSAAPQPVDALELRRESVLHIASGERIEQSVLASGDRVEIDGSIDGDLIAAAERVTVRGEITGSVYVFCRDLDITGSVGGALHAVAETSRIDGIVRGGVYAASQDFTLGANGRVQSDAHLFVDSGVIEGAVRRDVTAAAERLELRGEIGRNLQAPWIEELYLRDGAHVGGDVDARLDEGRSVERSAGARVDGEVRSSTRESRHEHYLDHYRSWRFYAGHLAWFAAAFVFGLIAYRLGPVIFRGRVATGSEFLRALALGFVTLVVMPVAMIAAALTVVGIPTAIAALFLYIVALYTADLVVGAWLGGLLVPPADDSLFEFGKSLAAGLAILTAISLIPFLGPPAGVVALLLGLGLLTERARAALL